MHLVPSDCENNVDFEPINHQLKGSHSKRPQWPSGKVSVPGRRSPDSKPDYPEDPPCMAPIARHAVAKSPPAGVVWKLGEGTG
ncbi:hypothetical protein AVEN_191697-1 [Araneus ventricosus]|uniref:Uncharacterized protein n=1 Tax=Araneus ventricosus TaxID=182803 RepID=A0A4Y2QBC0_ARAVE|nr:hypothetical protein AVEN_191697-1 [Araneus ventricosus]